MKTLFTILTLLCAAIVAQAAETAPATAPSMAACKADAEKLCPGVQPGEGRLKACFKEHAKELSPDCKKELREMAKARNNKG